MNKPAKKPLAVLGSVNADFFVKVARLPAAGDTIPGTNPRCLPGGKGANQAVAAQQLNRDVHFIGQFGSDSLGPWLLKRMQGYGVNCDHLRERVGASGQAWILQLPDGDNSIILQGAANQSWDLTEWDFFEILKGCSALLLQREIPSEVNLAAATAAVQLKLPIFMDVGGSEEPLDTKLAPLLTWISPNRGEMEALLQRSVAADEGSLQLAARELMSLGPKAVLLKLGSEGSAWLDNSGKWLRCHAQKVSVTDTTGAGDCFTGAFATAQLEGKTISKALEFATAAAAQCIQIQGAMNAMPLREKITQ